MTLEEKLSMNREINQFGDKSIYVENHIGDIYQNVNETNLSQEQIIKSFNSASIDLSSYNNTFGNRIHLDRSETILLYNWIVNPLPLREGPIAVLGGNAGYGKSVIFKDLFEKLKKENVPVLGIKADRLFIQNIGDLNNELELGDTIESVFKSLSKNNQKFVLLVDQIDALSQSLSSNRYPLNTYHRLIQRLSYISNIRIVISCRLYDLDYDPLLKEYKNRKVIRTSSLSSEDVDKILTTLNIQIPQTSIKLKEFLRIPLHLQLFTKITHLEKLGESITLQTLYDEIWSEFILTKPSLHNLEINHIQDLIEKLSFTMYENQQLVINSKLFEGKYKKELCYLSTEEIVTNIDNKKIQFIHQSFFDYAYARTFIEKEINISDTLVNQHQGLFIRSRVKQVLTYLRELDIQHYINELDLIVFGNYRFHLKIMLINCLGFYPDPTTEEKDWVRNCLFNNKFLYGLFVESIYTVEWFKFIIEEMNPIQYFINDDREFMNNIYRLCLRLIETTTEDVISFMNQLYEISFANKENIISRMLSNVPNDKIELSFPLYHITKSNWDRFNLYQLLEKSIINNPDFVRQELLELFERNLSTLDAQSSDYIPGDYDGLRVYKELYSKNLDVAILFFIEITRRISEFSKNRYIDETKNEDRIFDSLAYFLYAPFKGHRYSHQEIYDLLLKYFDNHYELDFKQKTEIVLPLLSSDLALLVNLAVVCVIKNIDRLKFYAFKILSTKRFYNTSSEILVYNIKNLLEVSYPYFSNEEQTVINQTLFDIAPDWEKENLYGERGVSKYGYTRIGYTAYGFISMIPEKERKKFKEVNSFYKEKNRLWGDQENKEPQSVEIRVGDTILPQSAYNNMTDEQWNESFRKIVKDSHFDFDTPTRTGHCRKFEECVSLNPERFFHLIANIVKDKTILPIYSVYGMQGLKKANYDPVQTKDIFISFLSERFYSKDIFEESDREWLQYSVWLVEYFINSSVVDRDIVEFLKYLVLYFPEEKMLNNDPVMDGNNRIRGAASSKLVHCYKHNEFAEDIFSTLESMAENGAVHTRAAALQHLAYLNNLDKDRNLKLFLKLMHDYDSSLLKMPLHNLHPLVYLIHVDFSQLIPFFEKAIKVEESYVPISHILLLAWLNGYVGSESLLNEILNNNQIAEQTVVKVAFEMLKNKNYTDKCWSILFRFLNEDFEELGKTYEFGLHRFEDFINDYVVDFLDNYTYSPIGKYRSHYYYDLLLKISKDFPQKVIDWALAFENHLKPDIQMRDLQNEPLKAVLLAYNAIRIYDKKDISLEKAMDAFDEILKVPEYRNNASEVLQKIDA